MTASAGWKRLGTGRRELWLPHTLPTGQTFSLFVLHKSPHRALSYTSLVTTSTASMLDHTFQWWGVIGRRVFALRQECHDVAWRLVGTTSTSGGEDGDGAEKALAEYFNLHISLNSLWERFCSADPYFAALSPHVAGARMLKQDPVECLYAFICSQNNHIARITGLVRALERRGDSLHTHTHVGDVDYDESEGFHAFPSVETLAKVPESQWREEGFGYRAKFIHQTSIALSEKASGGRKWLESLAHESVGACVALFALNKHSVVPVDVHVRELCVRAYRPDLARSPLNNKMHAEIAATFRELFGPYAGDQLPDELRARMLLPKAKKKGKQKPKEATTTTTQQQHEEEEEEELPSISTPSTTPICEAKVVKVRTTRSKRVRAEVKREDDGEHVVVVQKKRTVRRRLIVVQTTDG
eukprot:jgi/Chlat1/389/Chrsp10S01497